MKNPFEDIKNAIDTFQECVSKDLEEIRKQKQEVQQMKTDLLNRIEAGQFIRDNHRIVLSAPEILIGNVDAGGDLNADGGLVIIKGTNVYLEGVGKSGSIINRATKIVQKAVDPGIDGLEAVVRSGSSIVSQARSIVLQSNDSKDVFSQTPVVDGAGIQIHSDTTMQIDASVSAENRKNDIDKKENSLKQLKLQLEAKAKELKLQIDKDYLMLQTTMQPHDALNATEELTRTNYSELEDIHEQMLLLFPGLYANIVDYIHTIAAMAEISRQLTALDKEKQTIKTGDEFKTKTTKAVMSLSAEHIDVATKDGDGNFKENDEAGIRVNSPRMEVTMQKEDGSLAEKSSLSVQVETVDISTANPKVSDSSTELPGTGCVNIYSKTINLETVDGEIKDKKFKEKALTKDGKITIRAEKMDISATDTEGKATGAIDINAKAVALKSMDVDKDKRTDKELAKGSSMLLLSEKMYLGAQDKSNKSKHLQAVSEELGLFADKTLEAQQGDGKAVLQLADNAALSGSKTEIYGATTIQAKTEIKDELKAPKATIDHVEAKSSFKSTNISDGFPVPAPPASAKLSTKLKTEDAPKS